MPEEIYGEKEGSMNHEPMIQISMFTDEIIKSRKEPAKTVYAFPWYRELERKWGGDVDTLRMIDKYSPWQMKLWKWLKKNCRFEVAPDFKKYSVHAQVAGVYSGMSSCPQKLISEFLKTNHNQCWWNYRHRTRGEIKWENLDIHVKIWLRENCPFNFKGSPIPEDTTYIFRYWYCDFN